MRHQGPEQRISGAARTSSNSEHSNTGADLFPCVQPPYTCNRHATSRGIEPGHERRPSAGAQPGARGQPAARTAVPEALSRERPVAGTVAGEALLSGMARKGHPLPQTLAG